MHMPKMKNWIKALGIACAVEIPLLATLMALPTKPVVSPAVSIVGSVLVWYHVLSIPFGQAVLIRWSFAAGPGPTAGSEVVYWLSVYAFQVVLTTPIMFGLLRLLAHLRRKKELQAVP